MRRYYALPSDKAFAENYLRQDAIGINVQRACLLCIDLANITIRKRKLGLPKDSRDSFNLLVEANVIGKPTGDHLRAMVGFRNVLVHEYTELDLELMVDMIEHRLDEFIEFAQLIVVLFKDE